MLSTTVTVELQFAVFPLPSVTVNKTVLFPRLEQLNVEGDTENPRLPLAVQLSEDPPLTCAPVTEALPAPSTCTVTFWQFAVGATLS